MSGDPWESLLDRDWSQAWDTLPEAPDLVARPKTAQITLRLPASLVERVKRVATARALPYHALVRSWLVDGLRESVVPPGELALEPQAVQLNVKLDQDVLDQLKARADALRRPYHRLAREWVDAALTREEHTLGLAARPARRPATKDLMVLLLHAANPNGQDAIRGMTRLQKLLFVIEQTLDAQSGRFYAFDYGPFNEQVNDTVEALALAGFLHGPEAARAEPPSFAEMVATASERAGPRGPEEFALNAHGHAAADRLVRSNRAYEQLFERIRQVRAQWDTPDLVERVYETWPQYAERSVIKDEVAARRARRTRKSS